LDEPVEQSPLERFCNSRPSSVCANTKACADGESAGGIMTQPVTMRIFSDYV